MRVRHAERAANQIAEPFEVYTTMPPVVGRYTERSRRSSEVSVVVAKCGGVCGVGPKALGFLRKSATRSRMLARYLATAVCAAIPSKTDTKAAALYDLVLYSPDADGEQLRSRQAELGDAVDVIVFAQTAFTFKDGSQKRVVMQPPRGGNGTARVLDYVIHGEAELSQCADRESHRITRIFRKSQASFCREAFARDRLADAFVHAGGTTIDWALISDADEIPRAAALNALRKRISQTPFTEVITRLGAVHDFKFGVGCERIDQGVQGTRWIKGPIAVSGRLLLEAGPQRLRNPIDNFFAIRNQFSKAKRNASYRTSIIANASWHFSSIGGLQSEMQKMAEGYEGTAHEDEIRQHILNCTCINCRKGTRIRYVRTSWHNSEAFPSYPDVPQAFVLWQRNVSERYRRDVADGGPIGAQCGFAFQCPRQYACWLRAPARKASRSKTRNTSVITRERVPGAATHAKTQTWSCLREDTAMEHESRAGYGCGSPEITRTGCHGIMCQPIRGWWIRCSQLLDREASLTWVLGWASWAMRCRAKPQA